MGLVIRLLKTGRSFKLAASLGLTIYLLIIGRSSKVATRYQNQTPHEWSETGLVYLLLSAINIITIDSPAKRVGYEVELKRCVNTYKNIKRLFSRLVLSPPPPPLFPSSQILI